MSGAAPSSAGVGLNLHITRTGPPSYSSSTVLGSQIAALSDAWSKADALQCAAPGLSFGIPKGQLQDELLSIILALINLDQAQIAYQAEMGGFVSSLQAQNRALLAETQGGSPSAIPLTATAPMAPVAPPSGISGGACALLAAASALIGGTLGFGVGRSRRQRGTR
jgi:hypothetical protein